MKKWLAILLAATLLLAGCGEKETTQESKTSEETAVSETSTKEETETESKDTQTPSDKTFKIGILQHAEHPALDDARTGFEEQLKALGVNAEITVKNALGDIPNAGLIAQKFVSDDVDLIYAIATPSAQQAQKATETIPIIFSAVTDAVESNLVESNEAPGKNITGTSDMAPMETQLKSLIEIKPDVKTVGIIFNTSEENSSIQVAQAEEYAEAMGLTIRSLGITSTNDIPQALDSIAPKVDALYTITDNMVANSIAVVSQKALEYKLVTIAAEDSHVKGGILFCDGISYAELGMQAAEMAKQVLVDGKSPGEIPVETAKNTNKVYNEETLKALGLDANKEPFANAKPVEVSN